MNTVYVTSHGKQFHDPLRHYMTGSSKVEVSIDRASDQGYEPCGFCFGGPGRRPQLRRGPSVAFLTLTEEGGGQ